ncbi:MAG: hypothetical protein IMZ46_02550, partial [Acidobacteria bacterium]|nr:hypothetical protein [Acidobacteriota bacterium]
MTAKETQGQIAATENKTNLPRAVKWLVEVLRFAVQLVDTHGKLGRVDNSRCQGKLREWLKELEGMSSMEQLLTTLPPGLTLRSRTDLEGLIADRLQAFDRDVRGMVAEFDGVAFVLAELLNWTEVTSEGPGAQDSIELAEFADGVTTLSKKILEAVSQFKKESDAQENASHAGCSSGLESMVQKLRLELISRYLRECTDKLQSVDLSNPDTKRSAVAVMAMFVPIADQYAIICRHSYARLLELHGSTVKLAHFFGKTYTHLAAQGFCTPEEKSDESGGGKGKLEEGTGLGDGEGADDISKDIQPDEDMTELAQEPNKEKDGDIEDQKDAVDMADEDMEGEMGSQAGDDEEGSEKGDEEEKEEMEEESGDVDDLDATAVDEKMWDGDGDEAEKDQKGEKPKGKEQDEQVAAEAEEQKSDEKKEDGKDDDAEATEEQEPEAEAEGDNDAKAPQDVEHQDQNVDEGEALELPDDMDLDMGDDKQSGSEDDDLDDLDDLDCLDDAEDVKDEGGDDGESVSGGEEDPAEERKQTDGGEEEQEADPEENEEGGDVVNDEGDIPDEEKPDEPEDEDGDKNELQQQPTDQAETNPDDVAPSDVRSGGQDQDADAMDVDDEFRNESTRQEEGASGEGSDNQTAQAGATGKLSKPEDSTQQKQEQEQQQQEQQDADDADASRAEPFRKLGDALEKWHRQQKEIKEPGEDKQDPAAEEMQQKEFQHLQDDGTVPDAQAIGGATEDEVQPIDDAMAIDEENQDPASNVMPEEQDEPEEQDVKMEAGETEEKD